MVVTKTVCRLRSFYSGIYAIHLYYDEVLAVNTSHAETHDLRYTVMLAQGRMHQSPVVV